MHLSTDNLALLRHDRVAERLQSCGSVGVSAFGERARRLPLVLLFVGTGRPSVYPIGNPIRHSTHDGFRTPPSFFALVSSDGVPALGLSLFTPF